MRQVLAGGLATVALALSGLAQEGGWRSLFDGVTLKGWHVAARTEDRAKGFWRVEGGAITCDSRGDKEHDYVWLVSDGEFGDFELKLKVRGFRDSTGNTGVQVRSRYDEQLSWMHGPQVDIHPPAPWRTGLIYDETRETRRWIFPSLKSWEIGEENGPKKWLWRYSDEGDGWNQLEVVCRGLRIRTVVNGVQIADFDGAGVLDDAAHRSHRVGREGHIALQLHSRDELRIQFKDIAIRPPR
jgi:hypothetical protein